MATVEYGPLTQANFWRHSFTKSLNTRGRLALCYIVFEVQEDDVVLEDMSLMTGLSGSDCSSWLQYFREQGQVRPELRLERSNG